MNKYVIIVAGGKGVRMQTGMPKQFLDLNGKPILMHSIARFTEVYNNIKIIVVLPESHIQTWQNLCQIHNFKTEHQIVTGGSERFHSVKNGLNLINDDNALVAIHDGVRPLVSHQTIKAGFELAEQKGSAIPTLKPACSIRIIHDDNSNRHFDRHKIRLVQTPQIFKTSILKKAYEQDFHKSFTDDASVVEKAGYNINLYDGNLENIKITTPKDFIYAEILIKSLGY